MCMVITLVVSGPLLQTFNGLRRAYFSVLERADLRSDAGLATTSLQRALGESTEARLDSDNRGMSWGSDGRAFWREDKLYLGTRQGERILLHNVKKAAFFRRDGRLFLSLELSAATEGQNYRALYCLREAES